MIFSKRAQADLALVLITFIWGSTFSMVKRCLEYISPILFVGLRFWIATVIVLMCLSGELHRISARTIGRGLLLSGLLLGGFVFQTIGLRTINPSYSAFITSLSILLVPIMGFLLFRQQPGKRTITGVLLATLGLFFLLLQTEELKISSGVAFTFACAVMFAFQILFLGRFVSTSNYRQLMIVQLAGTALMSSFIAPVLETPFIIWNSMFVFYLLITGVVATAFALLMQAWAQRYTDANHAALIFSLEPFFAALFAFWLLGHGLTAKEWLGGMLILAGILISELSIQRPD